MNDPLLRYLNRAGLEDGARLPPERELAASLGISRRALRQRLLALELDGRIWRGVGRGTFMGAKPIDAGAVLLTDLAHVSPHVLLDARLRLEPVIAATAAMRATPHDLAVIGNCVRKNAEASDDSSWSRWDGAFHRSIAASTRNPILLALAETLIAPRQQEAWRALRRSRVDSTLREKSARDHKAILNALRNRDPAAAAAAMTEHLGRVARMLTIDTSP